jgi:hypothetical protein
MSFSEALSPADDENDKVYGVMDAGIGGRACLQVPVPSAVEASERAVPLKSKLVVTVAPAVVETPQTTAACGARCRMALSEKT